MYTYLYVYIFLYIYMEISKGNSLCSYLKQTRMSLFFFLQNQRTGGWNRSRERRECYQGEVDGTTERGKEVGKGHGRVVQILCTYVCKRKMLAAETTPGMRGKRDKGEWWGSEFKMIYLIYFKNFVNGTMYPHPAYQF
jgi:hypothetical protein